MEIRKHLQRPKWTVVLNDDQVATKTRAPRLGKGGKPMFIRNGRETANPEIREWCRVNCKSHWFVERVLTETHGFPFYRVTLNFTSERDAALFKLFFA